MSDTPGAAHPHSSVTRPSLDFLTLPRFAIILVVLLLASFPDVMMGWRSFFTRDFANFGYPLAWHVQQSYREGEIPLCNPYNFAGIPFLAQWNTLALYPPSLIYILLPLPWSLNFFNLLHLYLGGLGMFCLARRWLCDERAAGVAGVAYAFSGLMVSSLMWPNNVAALGWLPCVLLAGERAACEAGKSRLTAAFVISLRRAGNHRLDLGRIARSGFVRPGSTHGCSLAAGWPVGTGVSRLSGFGRDTTPAVRGVIATFATKRRVRQR